MNTLSRIFQLINQLLGTSISVAEAADRSVNELITWSDELIIESQYARKNLAVDRAKRVAELEAKASDLPALKEAA